MQAHWFFSQFHTDPIHQMQWPVCSAYGGRHHCPVNASVTDGWALVQMLTTPLQMQAAALDPRVVVLPYLFDPAPLPEAVTTAYASLGATAGMSLGALLACLSKSEPRYAEELDW